MPTTTDIDFFLKRIEIHPHELVDDIVENMNHYKLLHDSYKQHYGNITCRTNLAIKILASELIREDNHGWADFDNYFDQISELLNSASLDEINVLIQYFMRDQDKYYQYVEVDTYFYLEYENERISVEFMNTLLTRSIIDYLNLELCQVKHSLLLILKPQEWYSLYLLFPEEYEDGKYEDDCERIDSIVSSIFDISV